MAFANRGASAEKKVKEYLDLWQAASPYREYARLTDSKAAGRIVKAADADFAYWCHEYETEREHGLIEVKETEHLYRLARDKVPQLPRLRKREKCGGRSVVLVLHSVSKQWRALTIPYLENTGDKGSWNLTEEPAFTSAAYALQHFNQKVFSL
jgi:hypothetical protein